MKIGVLGAGAIGCWMGGALSASGHHVVMVGRDWACQAIQANGLRLIRRDGWERVVAPTMTTHVEDLAACEAILVAVKGRDTLAAGEQLATVLPPGAVVWSCQNGLHNAERLASVMPQQEVLAGMISFNVVRVDAATYRQGTSGPIAMPRSKAATHLAVALTGAGFDLLVRADMRPVLASKLVFNMNNAVNALSNLPLREQLLDPGYRRVVAKSMDEALAVLTACGMSPVRLGTLIPTLAPHVLRLPTPVFQLVARSMIAIDGQARSSMWEDLSRGKPTEIDDLNGAIVELGKARGIPTPVNDRLVGLIRQAEAMGAAPGYSAGVLMGTASA